MICSGTHLVQDQYIWLRINYRPTYTWRPRRQRCSPSKPSTPECAADYPNRNLGLSPYLPVQEMSSICFLIGTISSQQWHHRSHGRGDGDQMGTSHSSASLLFNTHSCGFPSVRCLSYLADCWGSSFCAAAIKGFLKKIAFSFQYSRHRLNQCCSTSPHASVLVAMIDSTGSVAPFILDTDWSSLKRLCCDFSKVACGGCLILQAFRPLINTLLLPPPPPSTPPTLKKKGGHQCPGKGQTPPYSDKHAQMKKHIDLGSWCSFQIPVRIHPPHWFHYLLWLSNWREHNSVPTRLIGKTCPKGQVIKGEECCKRDRDKWQTGSWLFKSCSASLLRCPYCSSRLSVCRGKPCFTNRLQGHLATCDKLID